MAAIVAVNFDWSIESRDKAPRDLDYERNTEKYGRAMKLTIKMILWSKKYQIYLKHYPSYLLNKLTLIELSHEKTCILNMQKQRRTQFISAFFAT